MAPVHTNPWNRKSAQLTLLSRAGRWTKYVKRDENPNPNYGRTTDLPLQWSNWIGLDWKIPNFFHPPLPPIQNPVRPSLHNVHLHPYQSSKRGGVPSRPNLHASVLRPFHMELDRGLKKKKKKRKKKTPPYISSYFGLSGVSSAWTHEGCEGQGPKVLPSGLARQRAERGARARTWALVGTGVGACWVHRWDEVQKCGRGGLGLQRHIWIWLSSGIPGFHCTWDGLFKKVVFFLLCYSSSWCFN